MPKHLPPKIHNATIAQIAADFHTAAGTLTTKVANAIDRLSSASAFGQLCHQPNYLPYLNLFAQFALLKNTCSRETRLGDDSNPLPAVFLVQDIDEAVDRRFRTAEVPLARSSPSIAKLHLFSPKDRYGRRIASRCEHLSLENIESHISIVNSASEEFLRHVLDVSRANESSTSSLESTKLLIDAAHSTANARARTLAEYTAFFLSFIINCVHDEPVVFVPHTNLLTHKALHASHVISQLLEKCRGFQRDCSHDIANRLLWWLCGCGARRPMIYMPELESFTTTTKCSDCDDASQRVLSQNQIEPRFGVDVIPRVVLDNLLDDASVHRSVGVSYSGSAAHLNEKTGFAKLIDLTVADEIIWRPRLEIRDHAISGHVNAQTTSALEFFKSGRASFPMYYNVFGGHEAFWRNLCDHTHHADSACLPLRITI